ncbi:helix-turn-helix transcriptional regulator [Streptomyces sp. NPDC093085]|uniref:helix-turn-helix domain-containing protein n=1 Tax=Streptomyces sp. NPDC093085 TaxID=3155068 RepID=UPI0034433317
MAHELRGRRKRAGKTQTWLARHCNMSQTKVSGAKHGGGGSDEGGNTSDGSGPATGR